MTMKTIFDGVTSFVIWLYYDVGICINHISWIVWRVFDFQLRGTNLKILYCLTYTIHFYSTITIFWQGIRKYDVVDIFGIVYEMRKERVWMVQTEQQYICIHQVSIKLKITNKALPTISLWILLDMAFTIHMNISWQCYCSACCRCWRGRSTRRGSPWSCTTTRLSRTTRGSPSPACDWWRAGHVTTVRSSDWSTRRGNVINKWPVFLLLNIAIILLYTLYISLLYIIHSVENSPVSFDWFYG